MTGGGDPLSSLYVLAVLTSALLAFTKYLDDSHRDALEEKKKEIRKLKFPTEDGHEYIRDARAKWEKASDKKPQRACNQTSVLYIMILIYLPLYVIIHLYSFYWYNDLFCCVGYTPCHSSFMGVADVLVDAKEKREYGQELSDLRIMADSLNANSTRVVVPRRRTRNRR